MQTPSKQPGSAEKLYEIPSCTICLQELVEDLSSLTCGHIFHLGCISQHFEYRGTCPNCQKRASLKQVRTIHFAPVPKNIQAQIHINSLLSNLPASEKNQMEALINELRASNEGSEQLKQKVASLESDIRSKNKTVAALREEIYKHKVEGDRLIGQNRRLDEAYRVTNQQLDSLTKSQQKLQRQCGRLRKEEREFEQMKRFKGLLQENSQEIVNYRQQMEANCTPPQKMANNFYQMLLMKNLELLRAKSRIKELLDIETQKNGEINRQKSTIESLRKENKQRNEKRIHEQVKQEENIEKQRLVEMASLNGTKITDFMIDENSQSTAHKNAKNTESSLAVQSTVRKPFFGLGSSTIGGFTIKKRDDKLKTSL